MLGINTCQRPWEVCTTFLRILHTNIHLVRTLAFIIIPFFQMWKQSKWPHCLYMILLVRAKSNADVVQKITATNTSYLLREKRLFVQKLLKSDNGKFSYPQTVCVVFPLPLCYTRFSLMPDPWLRFWWGNSPYVIFRIGGAPSFQGNKGGRETLIHNKTQNFQPVRKSFTCPIFLRGKKI